MKLITDERLKRLENPTLTPDARALLRCQFTAELIHVGQYEAARQALGELWHGIGKRPKLKGLSSPVQAETLLQCGVLSGWLGSLTQFADAQEGAKDLLTVALRRFQAQGRNSKVAETQYELGLCYFRLGAYDESRIVLDEAVRGLSEDDVQLKARTLIRRSFVELWTGRHHDALRILEEAQPFFESGDDALKGRWHGQMGLVLRRLATAEGRTDYTDRAIIEYTAAAYHFEQSHNESYCGRALNNLAFLFYKLARYDEAHENLDRAAAIFERQNDEGATAQVKETRARVLIAEGRYKEANSVIAEAIETFEKGGEHALLADAFTIQGIVRSRLGIHDSSINILRRAVSVAQDSGALSSAGTAALTLIEEHGSERLSEQELHSVYLRADSLLKDTQDAEEIARLRACARIVVQRLFVVRVNVDKEGLPLRKVLAAYEARLIEEALELEHGSVTRAAKRLGLKHQTLSSILKKRHKSLLKKRTPLTTRRHSIFPGPNKQQRSASVRRSRTVTILFVEDNEEVANTVRDTLELNGWKVESCADGVTALRRLASDTHYELLLFDNELPGLDGLELVRTARKLPHRRRTPIVMFSASDVEADAWKAGVDAFLKKPEDISAMTSMIARLLKSKGNC